MRDLSTPWLDRYAATLFARFSDSCWLYASLPTLSVWPATSMTVLLYSLSVASHLVEHRVEL